MYEYRVLRIEKVVDGDTVDIVIDLGFSLTKKERVRLSGIDTPETRTKDLEEKELGMDAKNFLTRRLDDAVGYNLVVKTEKDGKYGRMLGEFHIGDINLNEEMYDRGYAWRYDGGTKKKDLVDLKIKRGIIKEV
jgi:endonuclease YncB( thermonuclease family)|tara:strand:- start:399 stop:800 length:402 start_codon:yes stop_codon:yes gene_type:complete